MHIPLPPRQHVSVFALSLVSFWVLAVWPLNADCADVQSSVGANQESTGQAASSGETYILGPQDQLTIHVVNMEEIGVKPYPIDLSGYLTLPRIGRIHAAGRTVEELRKELTLRLKEYLQDPVVNIIVTTFESQPVSILGAVRNPGVHQIKGQKTLFEVISEAGGLSGDAGNTITITRPLVNGPLPLPSAHNDASGLYSIADLNIRSVMDATMPSDNIPIKARDVITVPRADLVYVIGAVKRPGGYALKERANMTILEALSLSEGLDRAASSRNARILRSVDGTHSRTEIPVNVQKILDGKVGDQPLLSNDILFIPTSAVKQASVRAIESLVQVGTGLAVYR